MTASQKISARIMAEFVRNGGDFPKALDFVMGEGFYMAMAGEVYHALRAKAGM